MPSRRQFLVRAGGALLAAAWPLTGGAGGRSVTVLGAGLAGLHAARLLERQGCSVTVLEARQRIGGRVRTLDELPGAPEAGANIFGPNYGRAVGAARELGVPLTASPRDAETGLILDGRIVDRAGWPDSPLNTLPPALREITPDRLAGALLRGNPLQTSTHWRAPAAQQWDVSATAFFRERGLDDTALAWIDANNSYGNRLGDTSLLALYRVGESIGRAITMARGAGLPSLHVATGNLRLPEAMADSLAGPVRLGERVMRIRQSATETIVHCENGAEYRADAVICTLPATAVRRLHFEPGLPGEPAGAFRQVRYHKITQAHLLAAEPFWDKAGRPASWWTDGPLGRVFAWPAANEAGSRNLTVWINGDDCDHYGGMEEEEAAAAILSEFERVIPDARGAVSVGRVVRWAEEPFSEGAWAIWRPGEITAGMPSRLAAAHGRVSFAGEHTAVSYSGMEGAMESAERAVLETLRRLA
ncbi:MAG TPA: NAD(P)/FAD-dependent oxidoreductase [Woeseiaceae bacterium]|nr:NAD(P)/FAD-dependent oxidoreductase [Woeseiaceae bacterium]